MNPEDIARLITEDPDISCVITEDIRNQEIYDFYAIVGSFVHEYFEDFIDATATTIYHEFKKALAKASLAGFTGGTCGVPTLEKWQSWGGDPTLYDKLMDFYGDRITPKDKASWRKCDEADFVGAIYLTGEEGTDVLDNQEITNLYQVVDARGDMSFFGGGTWSGTWKDFLKHAKNLNHQDLNKRVSAIDHIFGLAHHNGLLIDYAGEKKGRQPIGSRALNAKFNARTPADFWDKVSPHIRAQINHLRRSEKSLPVMRFNAEREENLFTYDHRKEEAERKNIETMSPAKFWILKDVFDLPKKAKELGFPEDWIQEKLKAGEAESGE